MTGISGNSGSSTASAVSNIPSGGVSASNTQDAINELDIEKQVALVSGTNIKTINGVSVLGSGDMTILGGSGGTDLATVHAYSLALS